MPRFAVARAALLPLCILAGAAGGACSGDGCELGEQDDTGLLQRKSAPELRAVGQHSPARGGQGDEEEDGGEHGDGSDDEELNDFTILAGAADAAVRIKPKALDALGWNLTANIVIKMNGTFDAAVTYKKGTQCVLAFSAADDPIDEQQILAGVLVPPVPLCGFSVHAGTAQELVSFTQVPEFQKALQLLNDRSRCKKVTSIGYSFGGAVAAVFAACANKGADPSLFGTRTDYRLVTFGAFPPAVGEMYSRTPGTPFRGTRYAVTERDGGANPLSALPCLKIKQFRIDALTWLAPLLTALGETALASFVTRKIAEYQYSTRIEVNADWPVTEKAIAPYFIFAFQLARAPPPGLGPFQQSLIALISNAAVNGLLNYQYDPVPSITATPFVFNHPLVDFQPLANPPKTRRCPGTPYTAVPAAQALHLPMQDYQQAGLAIIAANANNASGPSAGFFPNHGLCCMSTHPRCSATFNVTYRECFFSPLR